MGELKEERKICTWCDTEKVLSEFYSRKTQNKTRGEFIYYHPECKQCSKDNALKWSRDNPERMAAYRKKRNNKESYRDYVKRNREKMKEQNYFKEYYSENPEKFKEYRFARMNKDHEITDREWEECKKYFDYLCAYCGINEESAKEEQGHKFHREHVDHEGSNMLDNCVPSCKSCNNQKWQHEFEYWFKERSYTYSDERYNKIIKWLNGDYEEYIETV